MELWFESLAVDGDHGVVRFGGRGHAAAGGGAMEYVVTAVLTIRDGRILHSEMFDSAARSRQRWRVSRS